MSDASAYPVIDLFAGPGGLGEGFAALRDDDQSRYVFRTTLSIEKDEDAHRTLELRHFFRTFSPDNVPQSYYDYLEGKITREQMFTLYNESAADAAQTAWRCELGEESYETVHARIREALGQRSKWVLVGGPPCQAYSRVGRSRRKNDPDFEDDPRHFLYREYLRILADHRPPVFVMENVAGLLSAKLKGENVIHGILHDLHNPGHAVYGSEEGEGYTLYSLSEPGVRDLNSNPAPFVVRAEDYGIPQMRHRILIVGIRNDLQIEPETLTTSEQRTVQDFIGDLPPLRSSLSRVPDNERSWIQTLKRFAQGSWIEHGRSNGLAQIISHAEQILASFEETGRSTSVSHFSSKRTSPDWLRDSRLNILLSHEARSHMGTDLHRYFFAAIYAQLNGVTPKLRHFPDALLPDHKNAEKGKNEYYFADRFRVQLANSPASTITSHISKDGHYFIHYDPTQCRSLTVREAARLQTFPDNYRFEGNRTSQYQQVGNAVPPLLAMQIAEVIRKVLDAMN